ncbi:MAG: cell division protein FtsX [Flavobacteriales bacterium]
MKNSALFRTSANRISSFSTVIGITLVLTLVGALFVFLLVTQAVTHHFKEQLTVQVMLKENAPESEVTLLKKQIEGEDYSGEVKLTTKEEAAAIMQEELGEEFVEFLGYNPLPASIDIHVSPDFTDVNQLNSAVSALEGNEWVEEVIYQKSLLQLVNENMAKLGLGMLVLGILFLVIAVVLIVNTIELAIFSQRFIIKSMQLVGATHWFIQRPFLRRGLWYGAISSVFAVAIILGLLLAFKEELKDVVDILMSGQRFFLLIAVVFAVGLTISWLSTAYAVRRFVRLKQDQLY